jgi:ketosteroid isomerase-like protein
MIRNSAIFTAILAGIVFSGCSNPFAPPVIGAGTLAPILAQNCGECSDSTNAFAVISNFKYAYENRDLDIYENCLDDDFIFVYIDQNAYGEIEEVEIPRDGTSGDLFRTGRLFEAFDEIRLDTWIPIRLEPEGPEIHNGEVWEIWQVNFHLSLRDLSGAFNFQQFEANGLAFYKIRKSADGYWRIVLWEDLSFTN